MRAIRTGRLGGLVACLGALAVSACVIVTDDSVDLSAGQLMAESDVVATIEARNRVFEDRFAAEDADGVAALYTRDALLLPPDGPNVAGRAAIAEYWRGAMAGVGRVDLDTIAAEAVGEDDIVEQLRVTFYDGEGMVLGRAKALVHGKREDGSWRLHRDIWNAGS